MTCGKMFAIRRVGMMMVIVRWTIIGFGLLVWGCVSNGTLRDFTFTSSTDETFPPVEQVELYTNGVDRPHQVIGEVRVQGYAEESEGSLEARLLEGAREAGAEGVIVVERGTTVSESGKAGIRNDNVGGAAKDYRLYPPPQGIEVERTYISGRAIRFTE